MQAAGAPAEPAGFREGAYIYLWSTGGAEYARSIAVDSGISGGFSGFLPKPTLVIDDQAIDTAEIAPMSIQSAVQVAPVD